MGKFILTFLLSLGPLAIISAFILPSPIAEAALSSAQATPGLMLTSPLTTPSADPSVPGRPPLSLTLILLGLCCFFLLLIGIFVLGFIVRNQSIQEWKKDQQSKEP